MLETAKYIDGDNFVVIYKNFTKMTTEERIHLMEAIKAPRCFRLQVLSLTQEKLK